MKATGQNQASYVHLKKVPILLAIIGISLVLSACIKKIPEVPENKEFVIEPQNFSFDSADYDQLAAYELQPGDVLDLLFNIQSWDPEKEYRIALGDVISVRFPNVPELDQKLVKIPPDGSIDMPYIGWTRVHGQTVTELKATLEKKYQKVLRNPELYIVVEQYLTQINTMKEDLRTAPRGLSRLATIRPDGYITFPLIGDVMTAHKTIPQVKAFINKEFRKINYSLQADLFLETHANAHVYVYGAVDKPGAYEVPKPITALQAITLAGGSLIASNTDEVIVIRKHEKRMVARRINIKAALNLEENSSFFFIRPDDIVYVPRSRLQEAAQVSDEIARVIMFRGWQINAGANTTVPTIK